MGIEKLVHMSKPLQLLLESLPDLSKKLQNEI
jgi:hypothetical protein